MNLLQLIQSLRPRRSEHWIMLSILLYTIFVILASLVSPFISKIFLYLGCTIFIVKLFTQWKGIPLTGLSKFTFVILLVWTICLTIQMIFFFDLDAVMTGNDNRGLISKVSFIFDSYPFFPHLLPICICCLDRNRNFDMSYLVRITIAISLIFVILLPFVVNEMLHTSLQMRLAKEVSLYDAAFGIQMLAPAALMLFLRYYLTNKQWLFFASLYVIMLVILIFYARRGASLMSIVNLAFLWIIYLFNGKNRGKALLGGILSVGICYYVYFQTTDSLFGYILDRGLEDNRVERNFDFIYDINSTNDWLFGRGWFGQYYDSVYGYRGAIETGALAILLRGGFVYLIPYVLLLFFCFINGVFRSRNILCKSFGILSGLQILYLYPYGWPMFSIEYFLLWVGVFICNNPYYRNMYDSQIKELMF